MQGITGNDGMKAERLASHDMMLITGCLCAYFDFSLLGGLAFVGKYCLGSNGVCCLEVAQT